MPVPSVRGEGAVVAALPESGAAVSRGGVTFTVQNPAEFRRELGRAGDKVQTAAKAAIYREASAIIVDSVPLVPWDEGTLRGSHVVLPPVPSGGGWSVVFGYGGAASAYAEVQHERTDFNHPRGGQAHYLLTAVQMHEATLDARLAGHVRFFLARSGL